MAAQRKYIHDKLPMAMSYKKYLETEVSKLQLRGAQVVVKEYKARVPSKLLKAYEMTNKHLKDLDSTIVTIQSGNKIIAHNLITNEFYFNTVKVSDRDGTDDIIEAANYNFLIPLEEAINER